jgi:hypothetical protein
MFLGFTLLVISLVSYLHKCRKISVNNYKRIVIPASYEVFYVHQGDVDTVRREQRKILVSVIVSALASLIGYGLALVTIIRYDQPLMNILTSLYALTALIIHFFTYRNIRSKTLPERKIPYYGTTADLRYPIIFWAYLLDLVAVAALGVLVIILFSDSAVLIRMVSVALAVSLVFGHRVVILLNKFIANLELRFGDNEEKLENLVG